jgi:hypothetical protein
LAVLSFFAILWPKPKLFKKIIMKNIRLDKIAINVHARRILLTILEENPILERILRQSTSETEAMTSIKEWILPKLKKTRQQKLST